MLILLSKWLATTFLVGRALRCPPGPVAQGTARPTLDILAMENCSSIKTLPWLEAEGAAQ